MSSDIEDLLGLITGSWKTQAICVACQLGLPDALARGPQPTRTLADLTGALEQHIERLLGGLVSLGLCSRLEDYSWELTDKGRLLSEDHPSSIKQWAIWWGHYCWPVWGELHHSVRTGQSGREKLYGTEGFQHLEHYPPAAACFHGAMSELTRLVTASAVRAFDFSSYRTIADIGGGNGQLIRAILEANPHTQGILFDLPETSASMPNKGNPRLEIRTGDFFQSVPEDADLYILKSVLHDWSDHQATKILDNCRRAMTPSARLLVIDRIGPDQIEPSPEHQDFFRSDLHMMVALGGKERTRSEFEGLLARSGFKVITTGQVGLGLSFLECAPSTSGRAEAT